MVASIVFAYQYICLHGKNLIICTQDIVGANGTNEILIFVQPCVNSPDRLKKRDERKRGSWAQMCAGSPFFRRLISGLLHVHHWWVQYPLCCRRLLRAVSKPFAYCGPGRWVCICDGTSCGMWAHAGTLSDYSCSGVGFSMIKSRVAQCLWSTNGLIQRLNLKGSRTILASDSPIFRIWKVRMAWVPFICIL